MVTISVSTVLRVHSRYQPQIFPNTKPAPLVTLTSQQLTERTASIHFRMSSGRVRIVDLKGQVFFKSTSVTTFMIDDEAAQEGAENGGKL
jgi:hypothetical protein